MKNLVKKNKPYIKLKRYFSENGIKQSEVAALLNKSPSALNQNLNRTGGDFTVEEAFIICQQYGLSADEYFFENKVSIMTT